MINKAEIILKAVGVVMVIALVTIVIVTEIKGCDGTLVRGLFWFECVKEAG